MAATQPRPSLFERAISFISPVTGLARERARAASSVVRSYEAAQPRRGHASYLGPAGGPSADLSTSLPNLRARSREVLRNNPYARSVVKTLVQHEVGTGIRPRSNSGSKRADKARTKAWKAWAETPQCDFEGHHDIYGLEALATFTMRASGEALIRFRYVSKAKAKALGLSMPLQIQILEPDLLDTARDGPLKSGGCIVQGVEFDSDGRRVAFWIHRIHPGESSSWVGMPTDSVRISSSEMIHLFEKERPNQGRGVPVLTPVVVVLEDIRDYAEAWLMRGKVEACLTAFVHDDGDSEPVKMGETGETDEGEPLMNLAPGLIVRLPAGKKVTTLSPSSTGGQVEFIRSALREVAAGTGVCFDQLSKDTSQANYSSVRAARLEFRAQVAQTQWHTLIPVMCQPIYAEFCRIGYVAGMWDDAPAVCDWMPPRLEMIEPKHDVPAIRDAIRTRIMDQRQAIQEQGYDPDEMLQQMAETDAMLDRLGIVSDADPRRTSQQGQLQATMAPTDKAAPAVTTAPAAPAPSGDDDDEDA